MRISAVDLFCGAGGLTHGLRKAGIFVSAGFDLDEDCRYAYEFNNRPARFYAADIRAVTGDMVTSSMPESEIRLIAGCAPCQPFSSYSLGKARVCDEKWGLLNEFHRIVHESKPEIVTMENVPQIREHDVFKRFHNGLKKLGYKTSYEVVDCVEYGIPQTRSRLVLLASRLGPISLRERNSQKDRRRMVRHVIGDLDPIRAGSFSCRDQLHRASAVSTKNMERLKASKPGGTWRDWDNHLVADCHRTKSGSSFSGVYGRMSWDAPSPTITTQFYGFGNGRFGHPSQDRAISLREGALLQTFPKRYRFAMPDAPIHFKKIGRMVGNAVPVKLGQVIGESIMMHVKELN